MFYCHKILSSIIWLPIIVGILSLIVKMKNFNKILIVTALVNLGSASILIFSFKNDINVWRFIEYYSILPQVGINYALGVNGTYALLIFLFNLINFLILIMNYKNCGQTQNKAYLFILLGISNGILAATNAGLLYIWGEIGIVILFILINKNVSNERINVGLKFLYYAALSSILFLISLLCIQKISITHGAFINNALDFNVLYNLSLKFNQQMYLFVALAIAFGIKISIFPFDNFLKINSEDFQFTDLIFIATALLQFAIVAILKLILPLMPQACIFCSKTIISILLIITIYINFIAVTQNNLKKLITYATTLQALMVILGIFVGVALIPLDKDLAMLSFMVAILQLLSNNLIANGLFFCTDLLNQSQNFTTIKNNNSAVISKLLNFFNAAYLGIPVTSNFFTQFLMLVAIFKIQKIFGILLAINMLINIKLVFSSMLENNVALHRWHFNQLITLLFLALLILLIGIYPGFFINILKDPINDLILIIGAK